MIPPEQSPCDSVCVWTLKRLYEMTGLYAGYTEVVEEDDLGMVVGQYAYYYFSPQALSDMLAYSTNLN